MQKAVFVCLILVCLIAPVAAGDIYEIHANIVGAEVYVNGELEGTIDDTHSFVYDWPGGNEKAFIAVKTPGYKEIWDWIDQPWPGIPSERWYRLYPIDYQVPVDGDLRFIVQPIGAEVLLRPAGTNDEWQHYGPYYGPQFTVHYIQPGTYDLILQKPTFASISDVIEVDEGTSRDYFYEMEKSDEAQKIISQSNPETVKRSPTILVVETPTPVPEPTIAVEVEQVVTAEVTEEIPVPEPADVEEEGQSDAQILFLMFGGFGLAGGAYLLISQRDLLGF